MKNITENKINKSNNEINKINDDNILKIIK